MLLRRRLCRVRGESRRLGLLNRRGQSGVALQRLILVFRFLIGDAIKLAAAGVVLPAGRRLSRNR